MSAFDLVIFDCDGVLVDSEILSCQCLAEVMSEFGVPADVDLVIEQFLGRSLPNVYEYARARGIELPPEFGRALRERLYASFGASLAAMPGVAEAIERLDVDYCLASSSERDRVRMSLQVTGLSSFFGDRVYTAQMVPRGKPAPDLFLYAAAKWALNQRVRSSSRTARAG